MQYWRPEPKRHSFAWWLLLLPAVVYSAGVIVYAHAAFVPNAAHENGHTVESALMVIGGEAGTLMAASEVFRKSKAGEARPLDWAGLAVSLIATLGNLFVVYSALTALDTWWIQWSRAFGPLVLLLCSGLDFYANVMEFGFYNASFEQRWEQWNDAKHSWEQSQATLRAKRQIALSEVPSTLARSPAKPSELDSAASELHSDNGSEPAQLVCSYCGAERNARGELFGTQQAVSAHLAHCDAYQRAQQLAELG